ncbi:MAG: hypothetical protein ABFD20_11330 [Anaerolineales bacterium]
MTILIGIVLALIIISSLDKVFWSSAYDEPRTSTATHSRSGSRARARSAQRQSPARGWLR